MARRITPDFAAAMTRADALSKKPAASVAEPKTQMNADRLTIEQLADNFNELP